MKLSKTLVSFAVIGLIFFSAGCSSAVSSSDSGTSSSSQSASDILIPGKPDRNFDYEGLVQQIRGNQVTVLKVEKTEQPASDEEKASRREQMQSLSEEERAAARAERNKVTNEAAEFTIPVGIPIVSTQKIGDELETENLNISDIRQGYALKIWFAEGSTNEIVFLQVSQSE